MQAPNSSTSMTAPIEAVRLLRSSCQALPSAVRQRASAAAERRRADRVEVGELAGFEFGHGVPPSPA